MVFEISRPIIMPSLYKINPIFYLNVTPHSFGEGSERDAGENLGAVALNNPLTIKPPTLSPLDPLLILLLALHKSDIMDPRSKIFGGIPVGPFDIHTPQ